MGKLARDCLEAAQIFSDNYGGFNVVLAYGNCNDDPSTKSSTRTGLTCLMVRARRAVMGMLRSLVRL